MGHNVSLTLGQIFILTYRDQKVFILMSIDEMNMMVLLEIRYLA